MRKPVILMFTAYYLPGYKAGGVVRTIVNTVDHLKDHFDFKIVTLDRDLGEKEPYAGIAVETWIETGNASVYYLNQHHSLHARVRQLLRETDFDILHLNSFFDPVFTIRILLFERLRLSKTYPILLAPRGELHATQLKFKKLKKKTYIRLMRCFRLDRNVLYQASDEQEAYDIRQEMKVPEAQIKIAQDLPKLGLPPSGDTYHPQNELIRIIFLSRISKEKNLKYAMEILQKVSARISFDIYGPIEDQAYWQQCKNEMEQLPDHVIATYCGALDPDAVDTVLQKYDLFFLPTFSENYGHAIVDALLNGLPVLISKGTPWKSLVEKGLGWDIDLKNPDKFILAIEQFSYIDTQQRIRDRHTRKIAFAGNFTNVIQENINLYRSLLRKKY